MLERLIELKKQFKEPSIKNLTIKYNNYLAMAENVKGLEPQNYRAFAVCKVKQDLLKKYKI